MRDVCLDNFASEEQLAAFNDDGYLVVEDALAPDLVRRLNAVIDRIDAEEYFSFNIGGAWENGTSVAPTCAGSGRRTGAPRTSASPHGTAASPPRSTWR